MNKSLTRNFKNLFSGEKPIVSQPAAKVKTIIDTLFTKGHIDKMTFKMTQFRPKLTKNTRVLHADQQHPGQQQVLCLRHHSLFYKHH